eukprot:gnl/TRDRNA2_/TRDRNA2_34729_c0_seq1.p1 gnl/TRDRNA2_/TRDRNA2_34729_c0~~gnl/TRDRNA2_/TRDRNA2_34729_c0_seq1.p1  ORF type:complete len:202 (-),score=16.68 gnl/TRDRNA2_/TRDRNA2_34729_c0_seq1:444-1049(-)
MAHGRPPHIVCGVTLPNTRFCGWHLDDDEIGALCWFSSLLSERFDGCPQDPEAQEQATSRLDGYLRDRISELQKAEVPRDKIQSILESLVDSEGYGANQERAWRERVRVACLAAGVLDSRIVTCIVFQPAEDGTVPVTCTNMAGDALATIQCPPGVDIAWLRAALKEQLSEYDRELQLVASDCGILNDGEPVSQIPTGTLT